MSEKESGGLKEMRERISDYHVYDRHYERVGKVDDLFVDVNDELEYIGLAMGGMFSSKTALIPMELVRINDRRNLIEIEADKSGIEASPTFGKDEEITPDYEDKVHRHFGLQSPDYSGERGSYGDFEYDAGGGRREDGYRGSDGDPDEVDTEYGERAGSGEGGGSSGSEDGSREQQAADTQDDESERSRPGAAAETGRREVSSSGSSGGPRIRKRLRVSARREDDRTNPVEGEETLDTPEGTTGSGKETGRRVR